MGMHARGCARSRCAAVSAPRSADAQPSKLEAAYVVLGPQGPVARAVLAQASSCPDITIDGARQPMSVRALPDATFPSSSAERTIPAGATSASLENSPLPLPRPALKSIAAFGDAGCRLKSAKTAAKEERHQRRRRAGQIPGLQQSHSLAIRAGGPERRGRQARPRHPCRRLSLSRERLPGGRRRLRAQPLWRRLADLEGGFLRARGAGAARGPVDRRARQSRNLPPRRARVISGCSIRPRRRRRRHRRRRHASNWSRISPSRSRVSLSSSSTSSNAADACPCDPARYAAEFAAMKPKSGAWLLTHRPVWGFGPRRRTVNATLQEALANWNGQPARRHRARACRPYPCGRGPELHRQAQPAIRARHRRHAARRQDQEQSQRRDDRGPPGGVWPFRPPLRLRRCSSPRGTARAGPPPFATPAARSCSAAKSVTDKSPATRTAFCCGDLCRKLVPTFRDHAFACA